MRLLTYFLVELRVFNILAYPVEHWEWKDLVEQHGKTASVRIVTARTNVSLGRY